MAQEFENLIAALLRPPNAARGSDAVERLQASRDGVRVTDELRINTSIPEGRVGYARLGYSEVGAGAGPGSTALVFVAPWQTIEVTVPSFTGPLILVTELGSPITDEDGAVITLA